MARILGARHLAQAVLTLWRPRPAVFLAGAGIDACHAASMLALAVADPRMRRAGIVDAATAAAFTATAALTGAGAGATSAAVGQRPGHRGNDTRPGKTPGRRVKKTASPGSRVSPQRPACHSAQLRSIRRNVTTCSNSRERRGRRDRQQRADDAQERATYQHRHQRNHRRPLTVLPMIHGAPSR